MRDKEGELIEVFEIMETSNNKVELIYERTIILPEFLLAKTDNFDVLSKNEIFIS